MDCYTGDYMMGPGKGRTMPSDSGDRGWLAALDKLLGFKPPSELQAQGEDGAPTPVNRTACRLDDGGTIETLGPCA